MSHHIDTVAESHAEATSYFPDYEDYQLTPDRYLDQITRLKSALTIPVIASLNGQLPGGWVDYARRFESAGADALELNLYRLSTDPEVSGEEVEDAMIRTVRDVVASVRIPVAVKLSPFHASLPHFARLLDQTGVAGLVMFNRFYQADFDIDELEVQPQLKLSDSSELLLRLRWLAIISPHVQCTLASSGGAHTGHDVIKALLAGAHAVQLVSVLLKHGPGMVGTLLYELEYWMNEHGYTAVEEFRGAMNLKRCPNPAAFERANYQRILQSWRI
ncbi:MAG: hypothetical protein RIQ93_440 [Verrucomicrobiota bacterium]